MGVQGLWDFEVGTSGFEVWGFGVSGFGFGGLGVRFRMRLSFVSVSRILRCSIQGLRS